MSKETPKKRTPENDGRSDTGTSPLPPSHRPTNTTLMSSGMSSPEAASGRNLISNSDSNAVQHTCLFFTAAGPGMFEVVAIPIASLDTTPVTLCSRTRSVTTKTTLVGYRNGTPLFFGGTLSFPSSSQGDAAASLFTEDPSLQASASTSFALYDQSNQTNPIQQGVVQADQGSRARDPPGLYLHEITCAKTESGASSNADCTFLTGSRSKGSAPAPQMSASVAFPGTLGTPFTHTVKQDGSTAIFLQSISGMPAYEAKSFEELRMEDYAKGNPTSVTPSAGNTTFSVGGAPAAAPGGLLGSGAAPTHFEAAVSSPGGLFGSSTPSPFVGGFYFSPAPAPSGLSGSAPAPVGDFIGNVAPSPAPSSGGTVAFWGPTQSSGGTGAFASPAQDSAGSSSFGGPTQSSGGTGAFASPAQDSAGSSLFGGPTQSSGGTGAFAPPAQDSTGSSLFGVPASNSGSTGYSGALAPNPGGGSLFGAATPALSSFGTSHFGSHGFGPGAQPFAASAGASTFLGQSAQGASMTPFGHFTHSEDGKSSEESEKNK